MRINESLPTALLYKSDRAPLAVRPKNPPDRFASTRDENAALPNRNNFHDRLNYKTGDGDYFHSPQREGSDHSHVQSRGIKC